MADQATTNPSGTPQLREATRGRGNRGSRGNRRGGATATGGGSSPADPSQHQRRNNQGGSGGRGRGRGSGAHNEGRGGRNPRRGGNRTQDGDGRHDDGSEPPGAGAKGTGTSGVRLTGDAKRSQGEEKPAQKAADSTAGEEEEADENEICFICASKIDHISVAPCNHRTCHICSLRLRALYKTKACAHCRTESDFVIFTNNPTKKYEEFTNSDFDRSDDNLGIKYEHFDIFEDTVLLLRYNCPDGDCDVACLGWPDLHRHVKSKHAKVMCDLCTRNKKVFTHEHELFTAALLRKHERYGDDNPGAVDQSGFKGHPECGFCRQRFYGDDELYAHCRDKHERCHICDRRSGGSNPQYYVDYDALEKHFSKDHFLCLDKECLDKKFVVFDSQMDLKAHQLEAHPSGLSKDARRDARLVDMSTFDYRSPYQPTRQRRDGRDSRDGRGAGRGRDPNAEPIPQSSAQPLRRDELAYQRQMAIQSSQSVSTRTFGGQLTSSRPTATSSAPTTQRSTPAATPAARATQNSGLPSIEALDLGQPTAPVTPQDHARQAAHSAVMDRACSLLRNDQRKISDFRGKVSQYRSNAIGANELIEAFFSLFDTSSAELGKLIKELAHIYEDENKRTGLLKAWNDWRAINEDYPALPGPSGTTPYTGTASGFGSGKRVLRLKSSTTQSSRSASGQNSRLSGILPSNAASNPFPPLSSNTTSRKAPQGGNAWGTTPAISSGPSSSGSRPSAPASRPKVAGDSNAFPALPAAPKPNTLMAGLTRGTVRWDDRNAASARPSAWGLSSDPTPAESDFSASQDKKGKGKKGKQVLYHFG
ncbi:LIM domain and RING finger protein [Trichophyton interdigitale]|uniref:RING-type E3 ubiquitin transferase n=1 Tax=Trichophyton interdigitale TaxID=101480 RepID=A0A9P5CYN6_9EURO|nr:LIM domain and RING finger protein [Trichophyton interdigitale]KAF3900552.1 LIM domain and RING finger protein [Trichophyton interdigitale]KAG8210561.1 LIM domain and RING finger protein [Trichophyton interdigitale]